MAVVDDIRRLMQLDFMFLGFSVLGTFGAAMGPTGQASQPAVVTWHKGRLQLANDNAVIFRSISQDGTIVGVQLGTVQPTWTSSETVSGGIQVTIPIANVQIPASVMPAGQQGATVVNTVTLAQSLPQELS